MTRPKTTLSFFTIGHSNRSIEEFVALLRAADVSLVVDIRKIPRSRANPQFNETTLPAELERAGISYQRLAALGGRRGKDPAVPAEVNGFWTNQSFHNYADYALSAEFDAGLRQLIEEGRKQRSAMMCSEAVWWRCHRRIVADHLIARGEAVFHIMSERRVERAQLTKGALVRTGSQVVYPGSDS
jgi:uncharacterized protein (DUF488 family)